MEQNLVPHGYDKLPSALDLVTVVFATRVWGASPYNYPLGDGWGMEKRVTFSRCQESVRVDETEVGGGGADQFYPMMLGQFRLPNPPDDHENPLWGLILNFSLVNDPRVGVAAVRQFE